MPSHDEGVGARRVSPSHNGLERHQVSDIQRARMLSAMAEVACELGVGKVTVAHVVARSGVSRRTFYEQFADREECFLAAFDEAVRRLTGRVVPAYRARTRWQEQISDGLQALLCFLEDEPSMAGLLVVQALGAGPRVLERRRLILAHAARAVQEGRTQSRKGAEPPPLIAEGVVGAVFSVIHARMLQDNRPFFGELHGELMSMIVLPYLGAAAARRELQRPASPHSPNGTHTNSLNPLRDLEMRLTYRTMRVLLSIGQQPGASNRQIADHAGIRDQGQVSKLLVRLQKLGLIENTGEERVKGEPNAWTLTQHGTTVQTAISAQTSPR